jgi:hypothetical protein
MRALLAGGAGLAVGLAVGIAGTYLVSRPADTEPVALPPLIMPAAAGTSEVRIPPGFLLADARSRFYVEDQGLRWDRAEGTNLPALVDPCGETLPSEAAVVGARQVALVQPEQLWKLERVVVYRDPAAAAGALAERRSGLTRCGNLSDSGGVHTVWHFEPLDIGDEAIFVAGQRRHGDQGLPGHLRGVLVRQGRTVVMFVDFGQARGLADRTEVAPYEADAATMAAKLRTAPWN